MSEVLREFFGFGEGYKRQPEGYMSWQHLVFVSSLMAIMICLAVWLGLKNKREDEKSKNKVLIWSAILIDSAEIFKIIINCARENSLSLFCICFHCFCAVFSL